MSVYIPYELAWGEYLPLNLQFKVRLETNIKLQVIDIDGNKLIPDDKLKDPEVHFV